MYKLRYEDIEMLGPSQSTLFYRNLWKSFSYEKFFFCHLVQLFEKCVLTDLSFGRIIEK